MAPGPPNLSSNRFAILGDFFDRPQLPPSKPSSTLSDPKYLIITSKNNELRKLSPFIIQRGLNAISTLIDSISQLRDGNLLILVRNQVIANKFLKAKSLLGVCDIDVQLHETLNYVKGVVYAPCLIDVPEEEIVKELKAQGVVSVYKYTTKNDDGSSKCNGNMVLTFNLFNLPRVIDVAWYKVKVKNYFPNPMRCRNCQLLGHTKNKCSNPASCDKCNLPPHDPTECTRLKCANCCEEHPSSDKNCPRYIQQKEIIKIKTLQKCSFGVAKRKYEENLRINTQPNVQQKYSEIVKEPIISNNQPSKLQQKRNATSPKTNITSGKLPRRKSYSSSSNEIDLAPSTSTESVKKLTKSKKNKSLNDNTSQTLSKPLSKPKNNNSATTSQSTPTETIEKTIEKLNSDIEEIFSDLSSPIGKITQDLINKEEYYLPSSENMDNDG